MGIRMHVSDLEIDEISLVDKPANQHAAVVIAKRANQEERVPEDQYYDATGAPVDLSTLPDGAIVADEDGQLFEWGPSDEDDEPDEVGDEFDEDEAEDELGPVAKSARSHTTAAAFGLGRPAAGRVSKRAAETNLAGAAAIREALSKAVTEADRDQVISKALGTIDVLSAQVGEFAEIAKGERDLRRFGQYVEVAKSYSLPVDEEELAGVLMRASEALSYGDCVLLNQALTAGGEAVLLERGAGGADNRDPFLQVEDYLHEQAGAVAKRAGSQPISKADAVVDYFDGNPDAYDAYERGALDYL